eukprot:4929861-Amphidinium_carterae.1
MAKELGVMIEEPFSVLPLEKIGDGIQASMFEALELYKIRAAEDQQVLSTAARWSFALERPMGLHAGFYVHGFNGLRYVGHERAVPQTHITERGMCVSSQIDTSCNSSVDPYSRHPPD